MIARARLLAVALLIASCAAAPQPTATSAATARPSAPAAPRLVVRAGLFDPGGWTLREFDGVTLAERGVVRDAPLARDFRVLQVDGEGRYLLGCRYDVSPQPAPAFVDTRTGALERFAALGSALCGPVGLRFSPDATVLYVIHRSGHVQALAFPEGRPLGGPVVVVLGGDLAFAGGDRLVALTTLAPSTRTPCPIPANGVCLQALPLGRLDVLDARSLVTLRSRELAGPGFSFRPTLVASRDARRMYVVHTDRHRVTVLRTADLETERVVELTRLGGQPPSPATGKTVGAWLSPDERHLYLSGDGPAGLRAYALSDGAEIGRAAFGGLIDRLAVAPDGSRAYFLRENEAYQELVALDLPSLEVLRSHLIVKGSREPGLAPVLFVVVPSQ